MLKTKVLFICKKRGYGATYGVSYGLINSCKFVSNYLNDIVIPSEVEIVIDNNDIDRVVTLHKPTHVFIEAIWVVPDKFKILCKLHPKVKFIIRVHSKAPFLSNEGNAISWIKGYLELQKQGLNLEVSVNNDNFKEDLNIVLSDKIKYLPNIYYPQTESKITRIEDDSIIRVGCFGAHRILKNQLEQVIASIIFAKKIGKILHFYMNHSTVEYNESTLKNIKALFEGTENELHLIQWQRHEDFLNLVKSMHLGIQTSFSESFNIVTADFVVCNIPIVVGEDIDWINNCYKAKPSDTNDIVDKLLFAYCASDINLQWFNKLALKNYNRKAKRVWRKYLLHDTI